jgi:putative acetyltransferase
MFVNIREETRCDALAIREVNLEAFGRENEASLVRALGEAGACFISLVAERAGRVVGHILFSTATVESSWGEWTALGLGPLAVRPSDQGQGIGSQLVEAGLARCRQEGQLVIFVLGHPGYYPRFGFVPSRPLGLRWEHEAPAEAFMVAELQEGALAGRTGVVKYHPAFDGV